MNFSVAMGTPTKDCEGKISDNENDNSFIKNYKSILKTLNNAMQKKNNKM
jgi:hypothetical protein